MKVNVGPLERVARIVLGAGILSLTVIGPQTAWGYLGLVPLLTGVTGWCPPYSLLGISTCRRCESAGRTEKDTEGESMMYTKKNLTVAIVTLLLVGAASIGRADSTRGSYDFKQGSEAYFCQCDECACDTISNNPGKCTCGVELVKGRVTSVAGDGSVAVDLDGREKTFKTGGKFVCACPPACTCNTVSQNPGNCTCGKPMKEVVPE